MANTSPRSTVVTRMDDTANLRAMQKTPPSRIPDGRGGVGSDVGGKAVSSAVQKPSQIPSGRGAAGTPVGGTSIGSTAPVQLPSGRGASGAKAGGLSAGDTAQKPSRIPSR